MGSGPSSRVMVSVRLAGSSGRQGMRVGCCHGTSQGPRGHCDTASPSLCLGRGSVRGVGVSG